MMKKFAWMVVLIGLTGCGDSIEKYPPKSSWPANAMTSDVGNTAANNSSANNSSSNNLPANNSEGTGGANNGGTTGPNETPGCLKAMALARTASSEPFDTHVDVVLGEVVELDASRSWSPDGGLAYDWSIVSKPDESRALLTDNASMTPFLTPDLPGVYVVRLNVSDGPGNELCAESQTEVEIEATPVPSSDGTTIMLRLEWHAPGDANPDDDFGADVDLHWLRRGLGRWNASPWDCFWDNPSPDWGERGENGNPVLAQQNDVGSGPEIIRQVGVEHGVTYSAGVYYYNDFGLGPANVSVRLYVDTIFVAELDGVTLERRSAFLEAFNFSTDGGVEVINVVSDGIPAN